MPEISRFFGIVIAIYYNDHAPAHFHAKYCEFIAKIDIMNGVVIEGHLPKRALALVEEWRKLRQSELNAVWQDVLDRKPHSKIEPLE
jgi:Domain of unknown function (DUF4160)